ncbi:MBL fold metallo-hydrolase [Peribacillus frigoritolerans]
MNPGTHIITAICCLKKMINSKGISKCDITQFIATHGHIDHIGGMQFLEGIECSIHNKDLELIPENLRHKLKTNLPDNDSTVGNLECVLLDTIQKDLSYYITIKAKRYFMETIFASLMNL